MVQYPAMSANPILVAGGGIAGLAASIGLATSGRQVRLFEQANAFEEVGAGLQMSPNAVRALRALGAWDAIEPHCVIPTEIHVRDGVTGCLLRRIRLGKTFEEKFDAPYRVAHRADLLAGLLSVAKSTRGISLTTASRAAGARSTAQGAELQLESGEVHKGAAVIGADGIHSAIRTSVIKGQLPKPCGHTLYRALLPFDAVPSAIAADTVTLWLLPGAHAVHYPVSAWRQFNIVVAVEEAWEGTGWSAPGLSPRLENACDRLAELIAKPQLWLKWCGAILDPLPTWQSGNVGLVGDAAHATLPYVAQGAAMSLEDAVVLRDCLSRSILVSEALTEFESKRHPRCSRIQAQSLALGRTYHARGIHRLARNSALRWMSPGKFLQRLQWIYDWRP
jgi:salicylate hydroxylase